MDTFKATLVTLVLAGCSASKSDAMVVDASPDGASDAGATPSLDAAPGPLCSVPDVQIQHGATAPGAFEYVPLSPAAYPAAVCNDGSPAAYMIRPGVGPAASRWVLYLEGGNECYDDATCLARANMTGEFASGYTTSTFYRDNPAERPVGAGILDASPTNNPDFYDATVVYFLYCSSDDWSGAKTGTGAFDKASSATWNFQGRAITRAVIADLTANHGFHAATEVLLTGSSAGGVGVLGNTNDLAASLPAGVRFLSYSDAAYGNHTQDFSETAAPPNYTTTGTPQVVAKKELGLPLWNGRGDSVCAATATDIASQVLCFDAQTLLGATPTITIPMFLSISQTDDAQLTSAGVTTASLDAAETSYVAYFSQTMRTSFPVVNASVSIFSPDVGLPFVHTEEDLNTVFPISYPFPQGNVALRDAVGAWYRSPCTAQRSIAN